MVRTSLCGIWNTFLVWKIYFTNSYNKHEIIQEFVACENIWTDILDRTSWHVIRDFKLKRVVLYFLFSKRRNVITNEFGIISIFNWIITKLNIWIRQTNWNLNYMWNRILVKTCDINISTLTLEFRTCDKVWFLKTCDTSTWPKFRTLAENFSVDTDKMYQINYSVGADGLKTCNVKTIENMKKILYLWKWIFVKSIFWRMAWKLN